ncbi:sigma E protease regulator RseP [Oceanisphaera psychrotolerans]|uniref:Zinc metalloprotease n=1 Tax=Oceanisphaera psychrotolerans TaxID=1414654 RepID=A0A1J4QDT1_9GAMM|nr:sigma E protease regulator RseP [Oceanisphaera psychrotolerans]OIN07754.1 RIP metalloprotease RseP [Oceanisphaera psychrotolerans]
MGDILWNLGSFIVALGILVAVHEYGHFWVARRNGVKVERFSIGFGKPIWRHMGRDGTEYVLAMIPLGGYVKMLDGRVDEVPAHLRDQAFDRKSVWARMAIVVAGPMANFAFAIFAFWLMFLIGVPAVKPVLNEVTLSSPAAEGGLAPGMEILAIDGKPVRTWEEVNFALLGRLGEDDTLFEVQDSAGQRREARIPLAEWQFNPDEISPITALGLVPVGPQLTLTVAEVIGNGPAAAAGVQPGDTLAALNGEPLSDWRQLVTLIQASPEIPMELHVIRDGQSLSLTLTPERRESRDRVIGYAGVAPEVMPVADQYRFELSYGPLAAIGEGISRTWDLTVLTFQMIGKLLTGIVSVDNLSGPISIAKGAGISADYGLVYFLSFMALVSVNLGIINLLPLPVLDGGHLLFYVIEAVTGRPVPEKIQEIGFKIGAALLMMLMGLALFNDFARL